MMPLPPFDVGGLGRFGSETSGNMIFAVSVATPTLSLLGDFFLIGYSFLICTYICFFVEEHKHGPAFSPSAHQPRVVVSKEFLENYSALPCSIDQSRPCVIQNRPEGH
jgi:hypothetical protein